MTSAIANTQTRAAPFRYPARLILKLKRIKDPK